MNKTIELKIQKIRNDEVSLGYVKTKVGVVPKDWKIERLNKYFSRLFRKNTENNQNVLTISAQHGLIRQTDFFYKTVASEDKSNYYLLKKGDFTYNKSYSNGYPFGAIKRLEYYDAGVVSPLYICMQALPNTNADFYAQYFESGILNRQIYAFAQEGARNHGLLNLAVDDFFNMYVSVPSATEQKKIAEILMTQDRLIRLKEELVEEKKKQKKYLMDVLLTGKIRLPGFFDEWQKTHLKKLLRERKTYATKDSEYTHVTLSTEGIFPKNERYDRDFLVKSEDKEYKITHYGDICYNPANLKFGVICVNYYGDAIFSPIYVTFEVQQSVNPYFLGCYMTRTGFINEARRYEEGTVYERMAVKPEDMLLVSINLPSLQEQDAIAEVLSRADDEIELLQKELEEQKRLKQSLMQLLLTGIVRVNV